MFFKKDKDHMKALADLLANAENRDSFLGIKPVHLPSPNEVKTQAARLASYSDSKDYLVFVEECWGRILNHLDIILDDRSSDEKVKYHRGALKEALDLLRVSYQARHILEQESKVSESLSHE